MMYDMNSVKQMLEREKELKEKLYNLNKDLEILKYEMKGLKVENAKLMERIKEYKKILSAPAF